MKQQAGKKAEIDVDQIAQKLTVFCVSSTDYQHLTMNQAEETRVSCCGSVIDLDAAWHVEAETKPPLSLKRREFKCISLDENVCILIKLHWRDFLSVQMRDTVLELSKRNNTSTVAMCHMVVWVCVRGVNKAFISIERPNYNMKTNQRLHDCYVEFQLPLSL